jgi:hypothetical protein
MKRIRVPPYPVTPVTEFEREERLNQLALRRGERFFAAGGLCERCERTGDELIELSEIVRLLVTTVPDLTQAAVLEHFLSSVQYGHFPVLGTGFGREPERRAVRGLIDLVNLRAFAPGQYPLRPSVATVRAAPLAMHARRSIWVQWIRSRCWPVPPELGYGLTIDNEPNNREISRVQMSERVSDERANDTTSNTRQVHSAPVRDGVEAAMRKDIAGGKLTLDALRAMTEEALLARYGTSRYTCREARKRALANPVINPAS